MFLVESKSTCFILARAKASDGQTEDVLRRFVLKPILLPQSTKLVCVAFADNIALVRSSKASMFGFSVIALSRHRTILPSLLMDFSLSSFKSLR